MSTSNPLIMANTEKANMQLTQKQQSEAQSTPVSANSINLDMTPRGNVSLKDNENENEEEEDVADDSSHYSNSPKFPVSNDNTIHLLDSDYSDQLVDSPTPIKRPPTIESLKLNARDTIVDTIDQYSHSNNTTFDSLINMNINEDLINRSNADRSIIANGKILEEEEELDSNVNIPPATVKSEPLTMKDSQLTQLRKENDELRLRIDNLVTLLSTKDQTISLLRSELESYRSSKYSKSSKSSRRNSSRYSEDNTILNPLDAPHKQHETLEMSRSNSKGNTLNSRSCSPNFRPRSDSITSQDSDSSIMSSNPGGLHSRAASNSNIELPERSERRIIIPRESQLEAGSNDSSGLRKTGQLKLQVNGVPSPLTSPTGTSGSLPSLQERMGSMSSLSQVTEELADQNLTLGSSPRKKSPSRQRFVFRNSVPSAVSPLRNSITTIDEMTGKEHYEPDDSLNFNTSRTSSNHSTKSNPQKEPHYKALTSPLRGSDTQTTPTLDDPPSTPNSVQTTPQNSIASSLNSNIKPQYVQYLRQPNSSKLQLPPTPRRSQPYQISQHRRTSSSPQPAASLMSPTRLTTNPVTPSNQRDFFRNDNDSLYSDLPTPKVPLGSFSSSTPSPKRYQATPNLLAESQQQPQALSKPALTTQKSETSSSSNNQKPSDTQFDYLTNSIDTTVISVVSVVDPDSIQHRLHDFHIKFMVNSSERGGPPIPLYQVNQMYSTFLLMDNNIRKFGPINLPGLPDPRHFMKIDPNAWDTQKTMIRMYIAELCRLMRQIPKDERLKNNVWVVFKNFFIPDDQYDMSRKETVFVSVFNKNLKKNFRLNIFVYDTIESSLFIEDVASGQITESFNMSEINVWRDGQVLNINKKRKKAGFKSSKTQQYYLESVQDAEEWCRLIIDNQPYPSSIASSTANTNRLSAEGFVNGDRNSGTPMALSPSGNSHFTLDTSSIAESIGTSTASPSVHESSIGSGAAGNSASKWFGFSKKRDTNSGGYGGSGSSGGSTAVDSGANGNGSLLEFKAMPYAGSMTSSSTYNTNNGLGISGLGDLVSPARSTFDNFPNNNNNINQQSSGTVGSGAVFQKIESKYFGTTLEESYNLKPGFKLDGKLVPSIVYRCLTYLGSENAVYNEGIFRLNGMMAEVNRIQQTFNTDYDSDLSKLDPKPDVHSVATLLKRYLRTLKITIIPESTAKQLMQLTLSTDYSKTVPKIKECLLTLPELNFDVLNVLFKYFRNVLEFKELNKMSVSAISVLMAPNLTPFDGAKEICSELLINYGYYFDDDKMIVEVDERKKV